MHVRIPSKYLFFLLVKNKWSLRVVTDWQIVILHCYKFVLGDHSGRSNSIHWLSQLQIVDGRTRNQVMGYPGCNCTWTLLTLHVLNSQLLCFYPLRQPIDATCRKASCLTFSIPMETRFIHVSIVSSSFILSKITLFEVS